ncbi:glycoside hydrolase family 2 (plasmid) [Rathayibacter sp. VKM Ac-2803]|uniref:Beta-galactosidase n=1 Tax=Rathayibacter caricis DSM 15933 TaxID=1328867 RepID=A0A2T4UNQ4_9MICO|nr:MULTISPECIES: glycoside hydrolase family 2 TIM barrel-domain containing protein [Rathayibacter]MWV51557.1 glycoside hydrolase family 2 [Rathayibacter sp. VKM Ac-2803]PTL71159.1 glycoside hydrolase family 2 [Rathayibacter caricis DSM 15933]
MTILEAETPPGTATTTRPAPKEREPIHAIRRAPSISLDGSWQFQLLPNPAAPRSEAWEQAEVPSLWTMTSEVDRPFYTNVPMPFDEVPPMVPEKNPTGVYRRTVELGVEPGTRAILHVGAAEGQLTVVVNGVAFAPSTDSHLEAEFDVTDAMRDGVNEVELIVAKWSVESYLEDQDQWWHAGISRSVWISLVPSIRIADVVAHAEWDHIEASGTLSLDVTTHGLGQRTDGGYRVRVEFQGDSHERDVAPRVAAPTLPKPAKGRETRPAPMMPDDFMDLLSIQAASAPIPTEFRAMPNMNAMTMPSFGIAGTSKIAIGTVDVTPWSAERPTLYGVTVTLLDPDGVEVDSVAVQVGFRTVRIVGKDLLVNGKRVLIQGVDRHDIDDRTGRVISHERMLNELSLLKQFNVNAIRTAHYPNAPEFLDLCDEIGFYVVDEADVEAHGFASIIPDDPRYLPPIVERVSRMVVRDRNHPSVIVWSLGNESGHGAALTAAAAWVREADPSRPVHYEGGISLDWHGGRDVTDIVGAMYPSFAALEGYANDERTDRPLILSEYAYSQGNATGGLAEYWRMFETMPALQGGFIWEFTDHALDPDGSGRPKYGGDFGDEGHNGATMLNGIAFSDATPKPAMYEMRGIFSPVKITSDAASALEGVIRVRSRRHFADLSDLRFDLVIETRAGRTAPVEVEVALAAGSEDTVAIPPSVVQLLAGDDALALSLIVSTASESIWATAGTELSVEQVVLPRRPLLLPSGTAEVAVTADGTVEHALLKSGPRLCLWRALIDNDSSFALDKRFVRSGFFSLIERSVDVERVGDAVEVIIRYGTAWDEEVVHARRISAIDGGFRFEEQVTLPPGTTDGLRVGVEFELEGAYTDASWVGLGPWENYPDRSDSALHGRWTSSIDDLATPYLIPQENGTRGGIDELQISGASGLARARSEQPLHASVSRFTVEELEETTHWWKLPESERTIVHLDIAHRGVGTALLGPDTRPRYRLRGDHYTWAWDLTFTPND